MHALPWNRPAMYVLKKSGHMEAISSSTVQRWQEYAERFQKQEQVNLTAIKEARDELKQVQTMLKEMQDKGLIAIDADEDPAMEISNVVKEESSVKIRTGLQ